MQEFIHMIQNRLLRSQRVGKSMNRLQINRNALPLDRVALTINVTSPNHMCKKPYSKNNYNWPVNYVNRFSFMNDLPTPMFWIYSRSTFVRILVELVRSTAISWSLICIFPVIFLPFRFPNLTQIVVRGFMGTTEEALTYLNRGYYLGFTGYLCKVN